MKMNIVMDKLIFFVAFLFIHQATAAQDVIYRLDDADYYRMPPKNHLDRYETCVGQPGGVYCTAFAVLVDDEPNELLQMIQGYSAHTEKHYNYTTIMYGLCMTKTCKQFYDGDNTKPALWNSTERCLNDSMTREYGLKTRVYQLDCVHHGQEATPDSLDNAATMVVVGLMALNILGTLYDVCRDQSKQGNEIIKSFSLRFNWNHLWAPRSSDPRRSQLRALDGVRVMTAILVILGHVPVPSVIAVQNPTWFEWAYRTVPFHMLFQGHLITLTFFLISGFLLTYNLMIQGERVEMSWKLLPKVFIVRWARLTPANLMILLLTATWMKFTPLGPLWAEGIGKEIQHCREYWLYNFFYVNNLIDFSQCNLQTWSLASDMQLHTLGLAVALLSPSRRARNWLMAVLYVVGVIWPAYHIYTKDLDGTLLATPSTIATFFVSSDAFNYVYKRTYSNLPCFIMGMAFGYIFYDMQKKGLVGGVHRKWIVPYYLHLIVGPATVLLAYFLFFQDAPRASMMTRLLFAPIIKPFFGIFITTIILGAIYKVEDTARKIMEWDGWVPMARLSYCIYLVHVVLVRYLGGTRETLCYFSLLHMLQEYAGTTILTILFATVLHLLVEAPFANLVKVALDYTGIFGAPRNKAGRTANGHAKNGHVPNGNTANGHTANGHAANGHAAIGHTANGHATSELVTSQAKSLKSE